MIGVIGGTGNTGRAVVAALKAKGADFRCGVFTGHQRVSGTELSGDFHLGRSLVDGDNGMGSGEGGALKDIETDAAAAVDGDALAGSDLSGVGHGANAGGHTTAQQAHFFEWRRRVYFRQ